MKKTIKHDTTHDEKSTTYSSRHVKNTTKNTMRHDRKDVKKHQNASEVRRKRRSKRCPRTTGNDVSRRLNLSAIEQLYGSGLINKQVAKACGVSERTFYRYKNVEEVMAVAVRGRKKATDRIIQSLYKKAIGYDYAEVTMEPVIVNRQVDGKKEKVVEKEEQRITKVVIKHVQPDQGAIEFWLTNNDEKNWKKRIDVQSGGKDVEPCTFYLPHFNGSIQMPK